MATLASLVVKITGDSSQLTSALDGAERKAQGFGSKISKIGPVALAGIGVIAGGAAAGGVALFKLGQSFDSAFDTIAAGTGTTGASLDGLKDSFRNVFQGVATDMPTTATAITELSQRTEATGSTLEGLAKHVIELSRLTGSDLSTNIAGITRSMGDWGIKNEDGARFMDELFAASQKTGVGITALTDNLVKYGAPLRQMGFTQTQATATLAKFEKEGVNTELVMGSLRIALGKMAKGGEPAIETFKRVVGEIAAAGSTSEANAKALDLFGARAGPDMAAAIREGRFELGSLVTDLEKSGGAINDATRETEDFGEKWTRLKNKLAVKLEPVATKMIEGLTALATVIETKVVPALEDWYQRHQPEIDRALENFKRFMDEDLIPVIRQIVDIFETWWPRIEPIVTAVLNDVITSLTTKLRIAFDIIKIVLALIQGDWGAAWKGMKELLDDVWTGIVESVKSKLAVVKELVTAVLKGIKGGLDALPGPNPAGNALQRAIDALQPSAPPLGTGGGSTRERPPGVGAFATGTPFVPRDMLAVVHRGEAVIPASENRGGGGVVYLTVHANGEQSEASADRIARKVMRALRDEFGLRSMSGARLKLGGYMPG